MLKICTKCGVEKKFSEYFIRNQRTGILHAQCKECYKTHRQTYHNVHYAKYKQSYLLRAKQRREKLRLEFRTNMLKYLAGKKCVLCEESDVRVLELDHVDPTIKSFTISQAVKLGRSWGEVVKEIEKCQILCANCHKRRTAQQYNWYKAL